MRISDWSSDVCSSDLAGWPQWQNQRHHSFRPRDGFAYAGDQPGLAASRLGSLLSRCLPSGDRGVSGDPQAVGRLQSQGAEPASWRPSRSEEHTSELQSLMRISYAVFCLKKKKKINITSDIEN